uniref:CCHC-type domain-containing protein n=1 Tax=Lactuca sativa TaxID=4236 RepID=A0A9R1VU29_LACSA|nr:hypothetical protein LSAT_V11C400218160 [Lactuca sativa]
MNIGVFREELLNKNQRSIVETNFDVVSARNFSKGFFCSSLCKRISCWSGCFSFKNKKFNNVLAAVTGVEDINFIFPITQSWSWFLELLKQVIGMSGGLVFLSDIKKLYSARKTYIPTKHDMLLKEISEASHATITYINNNHIKVWSRSKFTTTFKCDCFINNISYSFSYGIGVLRYKHVEKLEKWLTRTYYCQKGNDVLVTIANNHLNDISKGKFRQRNLRKHMIFKLLCCLEWINGCKKRVDKLYQFILNVQLDNPKNRIKSSNESKIRHTYSRCGEYGHRQKTCKNLAPQVLDPSETSI